jgi:L-ascorbate metabolism protein UlaG (beta-lactamase superfamily)
MELVHFGHSCVLLTTGNTRLLFDPGTFSTGFEHTTDLDAVLITHHHFDHLDMDRLPALLAANPEAALIVDEDTATEVEKAGLHPTAVAHPGDELTAGGTRIEAVGGRHATIHQDLPTPTNAGYVVNEGEFYHPGDALHVPEHRIDVLALPMAAPWLKTGELIDFLRAVGPRTTVPIHEALLSEVGFQGQQNWIKNLAPNTEFHPWEKGVPTTL